MKSRKLGKTGLEVSIIGLGCSELGLAELSVSDADTVLNGALDAGINLLDTAACYGHSEEKIGQAVSSRRDQYTLSTKCGHQAEGMTAEEWTGQIVRQSLERSLKRLKTDHVDILLLHTCPPEKLGDDDLMGELRKAKESGKARFIGYSGDNEGAERAVGMDVLDVLETSLNICDQQCLRRYLPGAERRKMGVIVKRPIANGCWREGPLYNEFYTRYARPYAERLAKMGLTPEAVGFDGEFIDLALRFSAYSAGVGCVIIGSTSIEHLRQDIAIVERGPLPEEVVENIRLLWNEYDDGSWTGRT